MPIQIRRTPTPNNPPTGLAQGQLAVEMADPLRLWVGVPLGLDSSGRRQIGTRDFLADLNPAANNPFTTPTLTPDYDVHEIIGQVSRVSPGEPYLLMRISNNGTTFATTGYTFSGTTGWLIGGQPYVYTAPHANTSATGATAFNIGFELPNNISVPCTFHIHCYRYAHVGSFQRICHIVTSNLDNTGNWNSTQMTGWTENSYLPVRNVRFLTSTGAQNFSSNSWCKLYGIR